MPISVARWTNSPTSLALMVYHIITLGEVFRGVLVKIYKHTFPHAKPQIFQEDEIHYLHYKSTIALLVETIQWYEQLY